MTTVAANGIDIYYEQRGNSANPALLLISGLGAQLTGWPSGFVDSLVTAGFFVTIFDNRDVGLSSWLNDFGVPNIGDIARGNSPAPYLISDFAADAAALVDVVHLGPVHVVGVSMGGMIAQQFAIDYPELTLSLTSIMSTPHPAEVGQPSPEASKSLTRERSTEFEAFMVEELEGWRLTWGSKYPVDEIWIRDQASRAWERGRNADGVARHLAAVVGSPDRRPGLREVTCPALVIHGEEDPLVTLSGGQATAEALANSRLVTLAGVGHSLPAELWTEVANDIATLSKLSS